MFRMITCVLNENPTHMNFGKGHLQVYDCQEWHILLSALQKVAQSAYLRGRAIYYCRDEFPTPSSNELLVSIWRGSNRLSENSTGNDAGYWKAFESWIIEQQSLEKKKESQFFGGD